jgi:urease accessory protein UreE
MSIELSPHAKKRLMMRAIDEKEVIMALRNPDKVLLDEETGNFIAVRKANDKILVVA